MTALRMHSSTPAVDSGWAALEAELDLWQSAGRMASFWWRDDDAVADTPALKRLLDLAVGMPIALAVIPRDCDPGLADRLRDLPSVTVLQHGWQHTNHAPAGERKCEFGANRPMTERLHELRLGRDRLQSLFGSRALGVLAPPWNRIAPDLPARLPEIGITGLSIKGDRLVAAPSKKLRTVNVHADLVDWRGSRGFIGETMALDLVLRHLRSRFFGTVDTEKPTGILTHHLVQDSATERFLRRLVATVQRHTSACFVPIPSLFSIS